MAGPQVTRGARVPLFDRLKDDGAPEPQRDLRMLDRTGLVDSIRREVDRLLNTRTPLSAADLNRRPRGTLDYGLPDLSLFWPFDTASEARLTALIEGTVATFEPRLRNPRATVRRLGNERQRLAVDMRGEIFLDGMVEPVSFPVLLSDSAPSDDVDDVDDDE